MFVYILALRKTRSSAIADKPRELSLTNRAMLFCKVVEVLQDVLSENVDKKFTTQVLNYYSAFDTIILLRFYNYILLYN